MKQLLFYTVEVRDKEGKLLSREKRKSRSYIEQWNRFIHYLVGTDDQILVDIGGTNRTLDRSASGVSISNMIGAATVDTRGIVVGTGNTAVAIDDRALESQVAEGTGSGQIEHQAQTRAAVTVSAPDSSFTTTRAFINNSLATITVKEIGIYNRMVDTGVVARYFCMIRDVLATPQAVPDGGAITVVYTIKVTI